jgi:secondary thiamine-phosphate synthase enzyme
MLLQHLDVLEVSTSGEGFTDLTARIDGVIAASGLRLGLAALVCLHTSASLCVNENADPRVLADLGCYLRALVPQHAFCGLNNDRGMRHYSHDDEGPDDMPAHIRTALTTTSLQLSFRDGRLLLGTWQAVYLWEHRAQAHRRRISLHLIGS